MEIKIKGVYKHFKGDYYLVENIAIDADTLKEMVIYRWLYENGPLWVREKTDFLSKVNKEKYPNVNQKYKFEYQNIKR